MQNELFRNLSDSEAQTALPHYSPVSTECDYHLILANIFSSGRELGIEPESADAIITEPPHSTELLDNYEALAKLAREVLKPGGSLLAICEQDFLPEILAVMVPHIPYHWAYLTPCREDAPLWQKSVHRFWKPVLWFVKGEYAGNLDCHCELTNAVTAMGTVQRH